MLNILQSDSISLHLRITNTKLDDIKRCQAKKEVNDKRALDIIFLNNNQCMILLLMLIFNLFFAASISTEMSLYIFNVF